MRASCWVAVGAAAAAAADRGCLRCWTHASWPWLSPPLPRWITSQVAKRAGPGGLARCGATGPSATSDPPFPLRPRPALRRPALRGCAGQRLLGRPRSSGRVFAGAAALEPAPAGPGGWALVPGEAGGRPRGARAVGGAGGAGSCARCCRPAATMRAPTTASPTPSPSGLGAYHSRQSGRVQSGLAGEHRSRVQPAGGRQGGGGGAGEPPRWLVQQPVHSSQTRWFPCFLARLQLPCHLRMAQPSRPLCQGGASPEVLQLFQAMAGQVGRRAGHGWFGICLVLPCHACMQDPPSLPPRPLVLAGTGMCRRRRDPGRAAPAARV